MFRTCPLPPWADLSEAPPPAFRVVSWCLAAPPPLFLPEIDLDEQFGGARLTPLDGGSICDYLADAQQEPK